MKEKRRERKKDAERETRQRGGGSALFGMQAKDNPLKSEASYS